VKEITLLKKVAKSGSSYMIYLPQEIGRKLHGRLVQVTIRVIEELGERKE